MNNRIRSFRESRQMTQQELADVVGVSRQTIISLENGRYHPSLRLAYRLAKVFQVKMEDLFLFEEEDEYE